MASIRKATANDIPRIIELYNELEAGVTPADEESLASTQDVQATFTKINSMPGHELLIAEEDGTVIGTMVLIIVPNLSHGARPWAIVENMIVDNQYRLRGIGRLLMEYAIDRARKAGCYKIQLLSNKQRHEAHKFYQSLGFVTSAYGFRLYL